MHERRTQRSEIPGEAANLYLKALVDRHDLESMTLATDEGFLVAASSRSRTTHELEWIAALGTVCAVPGRRGPSLGSLVERVTDGRTLTSAEITLRGERLYVTAVGGPLPPMNGVAAAVERILSSSLPAAA